MTINTIKAGFDHLASWFPEDRQTTPESSDNADWIGWDGWVEVASDQTSGAD